MGDEKKHSWILINNDSYVAIFACKYCPALKKHIRQDELISVQYSVNGEPSIKNPVCIPRTLNAPASDRAE